MSHGGHDREALDGSDSSFADLRSSLQSSIRAHTPETITRVLLSSQTTAAPRGGELGPQLRSFHRSTNVSTSIGEHSPSAPIHIDVGSSLRRRLTEADVDVISTLRSLLAEVKADDRAPRARLFAARSDADRFEQACARASSGEPEALRAFARELLLRDPVALVAYWKDALAREDRRGHIVAVELAALTAVLVAPDSLVPPSEALALLARTLDQTTDRDELAMLAMALAASGLAATGEARSAVRGLIRKHGHALAETPVWPYLRALA